MKLSDALKLVENDQNTTLDTCPISKSEINTKITLPCNHSYEYSYLRPELLRQRKETRYSTSKCPYCRYSLHDFTLPFIHCKDEVNGGMMVYDYDDFRRANILPMFKCKYVTKSGKNKGNICSNTAHKFHCGEYCHRHYKVVCSAEEKMKHHVQCGATKKDGCQCTRSVNTSIVGNTQYCTLHAKKNLKLS
jgi:hypothetical protein